MKDSVSELVIKHPLAAISCYLRGQFYVRDYECVCMNEACSGVECSTTLENLYMRTLTLFVFYKPFKTFRFCFNSAVHRYYKCLPCLPLHLCSTNCKSADRNI